MGLQKVHHSARARPQSEYVEDERIHQCWAAASCDPPLYDLASTLKSRLTHALRLALSPEACLFVQKPEIPHIAC